MCLSVCDSCACVLYVHVQMLESNKMSFCIIGGWKSIVLKVVHDAFFDRL